MSQPTISHGSRIALALCAVFGVGLAVSSVGAAPAEPIKPCSKATYDVAQLTTACGRGGQAEAKKWMKTIVDKAKAAGKDTKCLSCHENLKDFTSTANAAADLKALL